MQSPGKKFLLLSFAAIVISLYKAFVLMTLWNWFVVDAFHVSSISFFLMLGVVWFVDLLTDRPNRDAEFFWKKGYALLDLCIPDQKRELAQDVQKQMESEMWPMLLEGAGSRIFHITLILALGFCVYVFV